MIQKILVRRKRHDNLLDEFEVCELFRLALEETFEEGPEAKSFIENSSSNFFSSGSSYVELEGCRP